MAQLMLLASRWMLTGAAVIILQAPADAQDIDEVRRWAEQGDVNAQHKLGRMYVYRTRFLGHTFALRGMA